MTRLKSCPFCGGLRIKTEEHHAGAKEYRVQCETCGAEGPIKDSYAEANAAWNTRQKPAKGNGGPV